MNEELKDQLECINQNLNAIAANQAMLYAQLKRIEAMLFNQEESNFSI